MRRILSVLLVSLLSAWPTPAAAVNISFTDLPFVPGVTGELDGSEFLDEGLSIHSMGGFGVLNVGCVAGDTCLGAGRFDDPDDFSGAIVLNFQIPGTSIPAAVRNLTLDFVSARHVTTLIGLSGAVMTTYTNTDVAHPGGQPIFEVRIRFNDDALRSVAFHNFTAIVPEPGLVVLVGVLVAAIRRARMAG